MTIKTRADLSEPWLTIRAASEQADLPLKSVANWSDRGLVPFMHGNVGKNNVRKYSIASVVFLRAMNAAWSGSGMAVKNAKAVGDLCVTRMFDLCDRFDGDFVAADMEDEVLFVWFVNGSLRHQFDKRTEVSSRRSKRFLPDGVMGMAAAALEIDYIIYRVAEKFSDIDRDLWGTLE